MIYTGLVKKIVQNVQVKLKKGKIYLMYSRLMRPKVHLK